MIKSLREELANMKMKLLELEAKPQLNRLTIEKHQYKKD